MLNDKRTLAVIVAFVVLGGIAVAGWTRHISESVPGTANRVMGEAGYASASSGTYPANSGQAGYVGTPVPSTYAINRSYSSDREIQNQDYANRYAGGYQQDGYYSTARRPIYVRQAPPPQQAVFENEPVQREYTQNGSNRVYRTEVHHGRSGKKSVAIVAGSAGVGAAIGAVAGGGKGAAIGALSGGGAGFIYDRLTHNH